MAQLKDLIVNSASRFIGPNGTISKMTREEVREYPDRIVGTVSEIPEYETWGTGNVKVNERIWIKVR